MSDDKGLDAIPVRLTPDQARIIEAHAQLVKDLASIEIPESGRWEKPETAIAVLEALDDYLTATLDEEHASEDAVIVYQSDQRAILQEIIWHLQQAKYGIEDLRLAVNRRSSGAAHDKASVNFKKHSVALVNGISKKLKEAGFKDPKNTARDKVKNEYRKMKLKFKNSASRDPEEIESVRLESWEKRLKPKKPKRGASGETDSG